MSAITTGKHALQLNKDNVQSKLAELAAEVKMRDEALQAKQALLLTISKSKDELLKMITKSKDDLLLCKDAILQAKDA